MQDEKPRFSSSVFRRVFGNASRITALLWAKKKGLTFALACTFAVVAAGPFLQAGARGLLINELVRIIGTNNIDSQLLGLIVLFLASTIMPSAFIPLQNYFDRKLWFFMAEEFELSLVKKRGEIDVAIYEDPEKNDLFQKVTENGIWRIQNFADRQFYLFQNIFEVVLAAVILASARWWVFGVIIISSIPELIIEARHGHRVWNIHSARAEVRRRFWDLQRHFQWLPELIELKVFQNIGYFFKTIKELLQKFHAEEIKNEKRKVLSELSSLVLSHGGIAFASVWFIFSVTRGEIQIGTLTFLLASIVNLRRSLSGFFSNLGRQYQDSLFVNDVFSLLDLPPAIPKPIKAVALDHSRTPEIVFEDVTFKYPGTDIEVLKSFFLKIPAGEKIALVGANGAGKTTLIKLLCRFYDPDKGKILIAGRDLRDLDLESWYRELGVLFQDYVNYHFIVEEAIAVGRTGGGSNLEKVKAAAQASEADIFIEEWEKAYKQMLGKQFTGGIEPSIGQWQKLALARTFYRDPRILILDEPTSSIDAESEAKIFEKLEQLPKDRTVILISHRFSTVRQASRICVIENGRLSELGTHEELLKLNGTYARLFRLQAKGYR